MSRYRDRLTGADDMQYEDLSLEPDDYRPGGPAEMNIVPPAAAPDPPAGGILGVAPPGLGQGDAHPAPSAPPGPAGDEEDLSGPLSDAEVDDYGRPASPENAFFDPQEDDYGQFEQDGGLIRAYARYASPESKVYDRIKARQKVLQAAAKKRIEVSWKSLTMDQRRGGCHPSAMGAVAQDGNSNTHQRE